MCLRQGGGCRESGVVGVPPDGAHGLARPSSSSRPCGGSHSPAGSGR